ncbi:MAG TPA: PQQ-binding-like beta-propeller repeat protein [Kofleriaceae bacterium]|nr:PQQ-binding-like beta-propeller repeat protein [Kofleriaceae bacterium]
MARNTVQHHSGFTFNYTDLNSNVFPPNDACIFDSMGWVDLDGDGCIDFVCIGTASGDYEDTDHEVVAIHAPSGNRLWTALRGEASKKLALVGEVVVVSTNTGNRLRGLDQRTGQQLWQISLDDALSEDSFDGADNAPTIAPLGGPWAGFQCIDDTTHVIDVRNGQLVKSIQGELRPHAWNLPGLVAFKTEGAGGDDVIQIWDLAQGRAIYQMDDSSARTIYGAGYFGFVHNGSTPSGSYGTKLSLFASQGNQPVSTTWVKTANGESPRYGESQWGTAGGMLLGGGMVGFGDQHGDEQSAWLVPLGGDTAVAHPWPSPKPGFVQRGLAWCSPVVVSVWQKAKGTERLIACGHDPNNMQITWMVEELGGSQHQYNPLHVTQHAILVPKSNDNYFSETNPAAMVHLDPNNGQQVTEYPVENTNCIGIAQHFLVGCPDYFSGGVPVAYDTWNRVRVL